MKTTAQPEKDSLWCEVGRVMFIVVLVVILFLLGESMVHHRYFRGGRQHRNGSVGQ